MTLRKLFIAYLMLFCALAGAQEFKVLNFEHIANDISGRKLENIRKDLNGERCAIVKIRTNNTDILVESGLNIEDRKAIADGEFWIWIRVDERRIIFRKQGLKPLAFTIPLTVEPLNVYTLDLIVGQTGDNAADATLHLLTLKFNEPEVYVAQVGNAPMKTRGNLMQLSLPEGLYRFAASKSGFRDTTFTVNLQSAKIETLNLIPGGSDGGIKLPGIISIQSAPTGANVLLNGQNMGQTPYNESLVAGRYTLRVEKPFHKPYTANFDLTEGESKQLPMVTLTEDFGYLKLSSVPDSALWTVDGIAINNSQLNKYQVVTGVHKIAVSHLNYVSQEKEVIVKQGETAPWNVKLESNIAFLHVETEPANATLYIDEKPMGKTPISNVEITEGIHSIRIEKPFYQSHNEQITLNRGKTANKIIVLVPNFGTVQLKSDGAKLFVNDSLVGVNSFSGPLLPGQYTFKAEKPGHDADTKQMQLYVGQYLALDFTPLIRYGILTAISEPEGATILVDGINTQQKTPSVIKQPEGEHLVTFAHPDFDIWTKNITITGGQTETVKAQLLNVLKQKKRLVQKKRTERLLWLSTAAAFAGAGYYIGTEANAMYTEYSNGAANAIDLRKKIDLYDKISLASYSAAGACMLPVVAKSFKIGKLKRQLKAGISPLGATVKVNF